jgi:hypothetical protein
VKNESEPNRPGINYVTGDDIVITFVDGGVDSVKVRNQASGVYVEAIDTTTKSTRSTTADSAAAPAGSATQVQKIPPSPGKPLPGTPQPGKPQPGKPLPSNPTTATPQVRKP